MKLVNLLSSHRVIRMKQEIGNGFLEKKVLLLSLIKVMKVREELLLSSGVLEQVGRVKGLFSVIVLWYLIFK